MKGDGSYPLLSLNLAGIFAGNEIFHQDKKYG